MKHKQFLSLLLVLSMLAGNMIGCASGQADESETNTGAVQETSAETETQIDPLAAASFVPENISYDGETFTIIHANGWNYTYDGYIPSPYNEVAPNPDEVLLGDIIDEAVVKRNTLTEDKLDIKIAAVEKGCFEFHQDIANSVMANDGAYEAVCGTVSTVFRSAVDGLIVNLNTIKTLDLTHDWWDQKVKDQYSYGANRDILYFINGDINYLDNLGSELVYYNKSLGARYNLETPYDLVREHKWTFDKMMEMSSGIYQDLDNDGTKSYDDQYGYAASISVYDRMIPMTGMPLIVPVNDTHYTVNQSEPFLNAVEHIYEALINHDSAWFDGGAYQGIFGASRALFTPTLVSAASGFSSMEDDFGMLPLPLYDESQEMYYSPINSMYGSAYAVIVTADKDRAGYVLDVMGSFSPDTLTKAVIETTCFIKNVQDQDSAEMLQIVFDGAIYPANSIEDWGDPLGYLNDLFYKQNNAFASTLKRVAKLVEIYSAEEIAILSSPTN